MALSIDKVFEEFSDLTGIPRDEVLQILCSVIETAYLREGKIVQAHARFESDNSVTITAWRYYLLSDHAQNWRLLENVIQPDPADLTAAIDAYLTDSSAWSVDWMDVEAVVDEEFYLLRHHNGKLAVLPYGKRGGAYQGFNSRNPKPGIYSYRDPQDFQPAIGDTLLAAFRPIPKKEIHDGVESWRMSGSELLASRVDSIYLRLAAAKFLPASTPELQHALSVLRAEIYAGTGILIVPPNTPTQGLLGVGGSAIKQLRYLTGLRRLSLVYAPPAEYTTRRKVRFALRQVSGVKARVSKNCVNDNGFLYWPIQVSQQDMAKAIGDAGCNAVFTQRLAQASILIDSR